MLSTLTAKLELLVLSDPLEYVLKFEQRNMLVWTGYAIQMRTPDVEVARYTEQTLTTVTTVGK